MTWFGKEIFRVHVCQAFAFNNLSDTAFTGTKGLSMYRGDKHANVAQSNTTQD